MERRSQDEPYFKLSAIKVEVRTWMVATALTAVPAILAAVKIITLARGEPQAIIAITSSLSIVAFLMALFFDLLFNAVMYAIPFLIIEWPSMAPHRYFRSNETGDGIIFLYSPKRIAAAITVAVALAPITYWPSALAGVVMVSMLTVYAITGDRWHYEEWRADGLTHDEIVRRGSRRGTNLIPQFVLIGLVLLSLSLFGGRPWLPLEIVATSQDGEIRGYVLEVDESALTLLRPEGGIQILSLSSVKTRIICPDYTPAGGQSYTDISAVTALLSVVYDPYVPEECSRPGQQT